MRLQRELEMTEAKIEKETTDIDIYDAWCKGCGICAAFCPTGALARDETGRPYVKDISKCINCGWCEIRCPDFAITVSKKAKDEKERNEEREKEGKERTAPSGQRSDR
jgi:2-oxoglutarate ferredoxin oxidoreductase subunit delta